jgi:hypothetical protein
LIISLSRICHPSKNDVPKDVASDANETFWTKLGGEAPCIVQVLVDERGEVHHVLVSIVDP